MKTLLDKTTLVSTAASKATTSKVGVVIYCVVYLLFTVVMFMASWILALCFAAVMSVIGYFLYLSSKEKSALAKQLQAGNFKILAEPILKKEQEVLGKVRSYYFYLDERRRVNVDAEVFQEALAGHMLYCVYVGDATVPMAVYTERDYTLGKSLRSHLEQEEAEESQ